MDDYYQPQRSRTGRGDGGFAELLAVLQGTRSSLDLPDGYVFISYHPDSDLGFVRKQLRPFLSKQELTSWDFRTSERVPDPEAEDRLRALIGGASALLVVATAEWPTKWTHFEVTTARGEAIPILAVRPAPSTPCPDAHLDGIEIHVLQPGKHKAPGLAAALRAAGVHPLVAN